METIPLERAALTITISNTKAPSVSHSQISINKTIRKRHFLYISIAGIDLSDVHNMAVIPNMLNTIIFKGAKI